MNHKMAIFLADGFETVEALAVVDLVRRSGMEITMVSVSDELWVKSSHGIAVEADALLREVELSDFEMLILPGGMPGTKNLEACEPLMQAVDAFYQAGKPVSAICAAPTILGRRGYLKGRVAGCFPGMEDGLEGAVVSTEPVSVDGHVITARGMGCAVAFGLAIVERFLGKEAADRLAKTVVFERG